MQQLRFASGYRAQRWPHSQACFTTSMHVRQAVMRSRLNYRALTDALNALVNEGAVRRVAEKPARLTVTEAGRKRLNEYRS